MDMGVKSVHGRTRAYIPASNHCYTTRLTFLGQGESAADGDLCGALLPRSDRKDSPLLHRFLRTLGKELVGDGVRNGNIRERTDR